MDDTHVRGGSRGRRSPPLDASLPQALEEPLGFINLSYSPAGPLYRSVRCLPAPRWVFFLGFFWLFAFGVIFFFY